jgi:DNA-binding LytR/AlgR family response regulator
MEPVKILIVEDNPLEAEEMRFFAQQVGYHVTEICTTGESALKSIKKNFPDIVLLDIHLPGELDGVDIAGIIKKSWHLPVVFLTANPEVETMTRMKEILGDFFLPKPFNNLQLITAIDYSLIKTGISAGDPAHPAIQLNQYFFFYNGKGYEKICIPDILYIKSDRNRSIIHLKDKDAFTANLHLKIIERLQHPYLVRVHRSVIVNKMEVNAILENTYLLLSNGKRIVFSPNYLPNPSLLFPIVKSG